MQNQNNSANNKSARKLRVYLAPALLYLVLILLAAGSVFFIDVIWQDKAFNIDPKTQTEFQFQNGYEVVIYNTTYIVENYVLFRNFTVYPVISIRSSTGVVERLNYTEQRKRNLTKLGITIDSYELKRTYGDKELRPPYKVVDPPSFPIVFTEDLAKTTLLVNWRYNRTATEANERNSTSLFYSGSPNPIIVHLEYDLNQRIMLFLALASPYLCFVVSGFMSSLAVFEMGKSMNDYYVLSRFPEAYKAAGASEKKEMEKSLGDITSFPKKVGGSVRFLFGLSVLVVKSLVNNRCKENDEDLKFHNFAPFREESLSKVFKKYKKQTFEKIEDVLPGLKTVLIVTAFLTTTIGITFSFNVGAAAPFLYALALFYFFFNLGSILQFVAKSRYDMIWTIVAIFLATIAVLFPKIINILRISS